MSTICHEGMAWFWRVKWYISTSCLSWLIQTLPVSGLYSGQLFTQSNAVQTAAFPFAEPACALTLAMFPACQCLSGAQGEQLICFSVSHCIALWPQGGGRMNIYFQLTSAFIGGSEGFVHPSQDFSKDNTYIDCWVHFLNTNIASYFIGVSCTNHYF